MRDLVRTREDAVAMQRQARHRLAALLLRNDIRYTGKTAWTAAHRRWIARVTLARAAQRIAFEEYVQAVSESSERAQRLTRAMKQELGQWRWRPVVNALQARRGIQLIHAIRIVAELGDLSRFSHPRELMGYLGLIPRENSSGEYRHQGAITKAGNSSARRALVEAAWPYRNTPAVSAIIARRQTGLPKIAADIAWNELPGGYRAPTAARDNRAVGGDLCKGFRKSRTRSSSSSKRCDECVAVKRSGK